MRRNGFTLTELLVVMGIMILIMALAAPAFRSITEDNRRTEAIQRVLGFLRTARARSIERGELVMAVFDWKKVNLETGEWGNTMRIMTKQPFLDPGGATLADNRYTDIESGLTTPRLPPGWYVTRGDFSRWVDILNPGVADPDEFVLLALAGGPVAPGGALMNKWTQCYVSGTFLESDINPQGATLRHRVAIGFDGTNAVAGELLSTADALPMSKIYWMEDVYESAQVVWPEFAPATSLILYDEPALQQIISAPLDGVNNDDTEDAFIDENDGSECAAVMDDLIRNGQAILFNINSYTGEISFDAAE
jgi:prepilin-type N-terminal cleavage/methylation domain-containing protein